MTPPPLVGLTGPIGAGKDSVGAQLQSRHGYTRVALADPIREALELLNPMMIHPDTGRLTNLDALLDRLGWADVKRRVPEARRMLQVLGTEVGREILGPDCWAVIMARRVAELRAAGHPVVVTDVRFWNEVNAIRDAGGIIVTLKGPYGPPNAHASENQLDGLVPDRVVWNARKSDALDRYRQLATIADLVHGDAEAVTRGA